MPLAGGLLVAAVAAGLALAAPLRVAFVTLVTVTLLIPSTLVAPNGVSSFATTNRVVLAAFLVGMVLRWRRGEVPASVFRVTRVHVALAALAVTALVVGVGLAPAGTPTLVSTHNWVLDADAVVFFAAALAAIRAIGDAGWVARVVTAVVLVSAAIAIGEHYTGASWARWWFHSQRSQLDSLPAVPLERRLDSVRVRAAEPFALAFGWVCAVLLPLVVATLTRWRAYRHRLLVPAVAVGAVVLAMYWSLSRSAFAGVAIGAAVLVAGARLDRRVLPYVAAGVVAALAVAVAAPHVYQSLFHLVPDGSVQVRSQRLRAALGAAASRPYVGVGLGGLANYDVPTTDASYLLTYASLGVVGLAVMAVTLMTAVVSAAGALRAPAGTQRVVAAGAFAGVVAALVGAAAYDLFAEATSQEVFWLLVALCVAVAERAGAAAPVPASAPVPTPARPAGARARPLLPGAVAWAGRVAVIPVFALAGLGVGHLAPSHADLQYDFASVPAAELSPALSNQIYVGQLLGSSVCSVLTGVPHPADSSVYCQPQPAPGYAYVRVQAPTVAEVTALARQGATAAARYFPGFSAQVLSPPEAGRPTWARTAPVWMAVLGLGLAVLAPRPRRRRVRSPDRLGVPIRSRLVPAA